MAGAVDPADEVRVALGHPPQDEERGSDVGGLEQRQQPIGACGDAAFVGVPAVGRDDIGKGRDVEVVFDVDGHRVEHPGHGYDPRRMSTVFTVSVRMNTSNSIDRCLM